MTTFCFHHFPLLPKELRVQIWKEALPEPRVIELKLVDKLHPTLYTWQVPKDDNEFVWKTTSPPISIPLLRVSREARLATLEWYENRGLYYHGTDTWTCVYVDFSRDTFYLNIDENVHLIVGFEGWDISSDLYWATKAQNLAVNLGIFGERNIGEIPRYARFEQLWTPEGQAVVIQEFLDLFQNLPALKELNFVLDGRNPIFGGPVEIIEPTAEFEDYWEPDGRTLASAWIPDTLSELHRQRPEVKIPPKVGLKLLTNGKDTEHLERRWDYCFARCRFAEPGYKGHRSDASSAYDSDSDGDEESNEDSDSAVDSDGAS
jgi:hypothetical protein